MLCSSGRPTSLAEANALAKLLEDPRVFFRYIACGALQELAPQDLALHAGALARRLEDPSELVRSAACGALQKLSPQDLAQHPSALAKLLEDPSGIDRCAVCDSLQKLAPQDLALHFPALDKLLDDPSERVRSAASKASLKLLPLLPQASAKLLEDPSELVRRDAGKNLGLLPRPSLQRYPLSSNHVDALIDLLEEQMLGEELLQLPDVFKFPIEVIEQFEGSTWLHLAAARGNARACHALTNATNADLSLPNRMGQRPCDLALQRGHIDLAKELQPSALAIRGGTGKGIGEALESEDAIEEITWWTLPLPPPAGWFGTRHSMLRIRAGVQLFLVESAAPSTQDEDGGSDLTRRAARNGLYVSKWTDVHAAKDLKRLDIVPQLQVERPIKIRDLLQLLVCMGKYDAGRNNCITLP